jgi:RNA polymerase sigma-70 factor (ECF subfamily)
MSPRTATSPVVPVVLPAPPAPRAPRAQVATAQVAPTAQTVPIAQTPHAVRRPPVVARDQRELHAGLVALVPELRARALRLCGDAAAADDVVQDTVERALRFADQYQRGTNLRAWAFQILFSVFVTRWRRRRRDRKAMDALGADPCAWTQPVGFTAPDAGAGSLTRSTRRKLDALPEGFRAVIVMVDLQDRSYRDAARELGVPVGTVMSRLHRGRKLLAAQMEEERTAA